jgi:hypothetical protein
LGPWFAEYAKKTCRISGSSWFKVLRIREAESRVTATTPHRRIPGWRGMCVIAMYGERVKSIAISGAITSIRHSRRLPSIGPLTVKTKFLAFFRSQFQSCGIGLTKKNAGTGMTRSESFS